MNLILVPNECCRQILRIASFIGKIFLIANLCGNSRTNILRFGKIPYKDKSRRRVA